MGACGVWGRADASLRFPPPPPPQVLDPPVGLGSPPDTALELSCWPLAGTGSTVFFWGSALHRHCFGGAVSFQGSPVGNAALCTWGWGARWLIRAGWARYRMIPTGWSPRDSLGIRGLLWGLAVQRPPPPPHPDVSSPRRLDAAPSASSSSCPAASRSTSRLRRAR